MNLDHYRLMATYNQWMNEKLFAACARLPDRDRRRDMGAFFSSIHGTLNHLLFGDRAWLARFEGTVFDARLGEDLCEDFDELWRERRRTDRHVLEWAAALDPGYLATDFTYTSSVDGATRTRPTWVLVSHLFNHQTHHRGQVTTLMKQLGVDPGITDIPFMPDLEIRRT